MLNFKSKDDVMEGIQKQIIAKKSYSTRRNGNSISLRPIIYNCIRAVYYEIFDYEKSISDDLTVDLGFYFTGPIGSTLHDLYQSVLGLTNQQYTEKLITFNTFSPLSIRSRSDGIDLRDPNNIILYEFKTKESIPKEPYQEELLQNLFSVFLFRIEHRIDIRGSSMVYINRNDPYDVKFFNYDLFDESSSSYLDSKELLSPLIKKVQEILVAMRDHKAPSMDSEYIKKFAYGKPACPTCLYREHCQNEA